MGGCMGARDVVVAVNRADAAARVDGARGEYDDLLRDGTPADPGGRVELPPRSVRVLRVR
jgi:hypothetical protein